MGCIRLCLGFFRPGWGDASRKVAFGALLVVMLAGHLVPFALVIGGFAKFRVWTGFLQIAARHSTAALPGGEVTVCIATVILFASACLVAQGRFIGIETAKIGGDSEQCWF